MVRGVLADSALDPEVRALAVERLEARLAQRARAHLGEGRDLTVTLGDDGVARVTDGAVALDDAALATRLALDLVAAIAPAMGAARHDVKNGVRAARRPKQQTEARGLEATAPEAPAPEAPAPSLREVTLRLVRIVAQQQARIAALEARLDVAPDAAHREVGEALRAIEAHLRDA